MILDIPETYKNIAIMFSGGIDSALLLYLVGKQYPNRKIYAVTAGTVGYVDYPVHIDYARNVFDEIIKLLEPGAIDYHTIHYIDDRESHHCNKVMQDWKHIDLWIVGQNLSPPKGTIVSDCFNKSHDLWDLCPLPNRKNPQGEIWAEQHDKPVYRPLMFMNKKEIIEIYRNENVYHLIDYTRSCPKVWKLEEIQNFKNTADIVGGVWKENGVLDMDNLENIYNELSKTYEKKYINTEPYLSDELMASKFWEWANLSGSIVSLGIGSGQDIEILKYPDSNEFNGYDISEGMLSNAKKKFPGYEKCLHHHDCNNMIENISADILVSMFGTANYIGIDKLLEHYIHLNCSSAFFVFYNYQYNDGVAQGYRYSKTDILEKFKNYNPSLNVVDLFPGSNYYVVMWNENRNI